MVSQYVQPGTNVGSLNIQESCTSAYNTANMPLSTTLLDILYTAVKQLRCLL